MSVVILLEYVTDFFVLFKSLSVLLQKFKILRYFFLYLNDASCEFVLCNSILCLFGEFVCVFDISDGAKTDPELSRNRPSHSESACPIR